MAFVVEPRTPMVGQVLLCKGFGFLFIVMSCWAVKIGGAKVFGAIFTASGEGVEAEESGPAILAGFPGTSNQSA